MQGSNQDAAGEVTIRPFEAGDVEQVYEAVQESHAEVSPWMPAIDRGLTREDIARWIEGHAQLRASDAAYDFAIVDARDGTFLGGCGLTHINRGNHFANLYYWVRSSRTRLGVATAAARLLARFGLEQLGLTRIEIVVATENAASLRVAERAGATREGVLRNRVVVRDTAYDAVMFSIIVGDMED
jgi:ribosomal-protein-serine acetyltransferase